MAVQTAGVEELERLPQRELVRRARQRGIRGAYRMRKPELIEALRRAEAMEYADNLSVGESLEDGAGERDGQRRQDRHRARRRSALIGVAALAAITVLVVVLVLVLGGGGSGSDVGQTKSAGGTAYKLLSVTTQDAIGSLPSSKGTYVVADIELTPPSGLRPFAPVAPATLVGGDGITYEPSVEAAAALGAESLATKQVKPGTPTEGKIAFDVPPAAVTDTELILRDLGGSAQTSFKTGL
jgi:hypothetical protein